MTVLLLATVLLPLLAAMLIALPTRLRAPVLALAPWTTVPALVLALPGVGPVMVDLPWVLLGSRMGLDGIGQIFLLFTAIVWTAAGIFARSYLRDDPKKTRYFVFHLITLSGNLGVIVAQDLVGFYAAFALMTFAAYPLVIHTATPEARRAGRVYIVMAVLGEAMLLAGLLFAAAAATGLDLEAIRAGVAQAPRRDLIVALLLGGFAVKAGALPLHVWLPLAHPVAPTPASAVLSGCMIKAGLLGWLRFLPLGDVALPAIGTAVLVLGIVAAFFGVVVGVTQQDAKTALAYSSISQMGIINLGVGIALAVPEAWPAVRAAGVAYAAHHGIAKGALFLGVGVAAAAGRDVWPRRFVTAGLVFAALAVAGAPLTSGSTAKQYLKGVAPLSPGSWPIALDWLLPLTAVGTTLLMARFLFLVRQQVDDASRHSFSPGLWLPWTALLAGIAFVLQALPRYYELEAGPGVTRYAGSIWVSIWPIVAGALLAWSVLLLVRRRDGMAAARPITPGDLLIPVEALAHRAGAWMTRPEKQPFAAPVATIAARWYGIYSDADAGDLPARVERRLLLWSNAGSWLLLILLLFAALLFLA